MKQPSRKKQVKEVYSNIHKAGFGDFIKGVGDVALNGLKFGASNVASVLGQGENVEKALGGYKGAGAGLFNTVGGITNNAIQTTAPIVADVLAPGVGGVAVGAGQTLAGRAVTNEQIPMAQDGMKINKKPANVEFFEGLTKAFPDKYKGATPDHFMKFFDAVGNVESGNKNIDQRGGGPGRGFYQIEDTSLPTILKKQELVLKEANQRGVKLPTLPPYDPAKQKKADYLKSLTKEQQQIAASYNIIQKKQAKNINWDVTDSNKYKDYWLDLHWAGNAKDRPARSHHWDSINKVQRKEHGGLVNANLVNVEGGEVIVNKDGRITHKFPKSLVPPHPKDKNKINPLGTVDVSGLEGSTIIDKKQAPLYAEAMKTGNKLKQATIIRNVHNKSSIKEAEAIVDGTDMSKAAYGGLIKKADTGVQIPYRMTDAQRYPFDPEFARSYEKYQNTDQSDTKAKILAIQKELTDIYKASGLTWGGNINMGYRPGNYERVQQLEEELKGLNSLYNNPQQRNSEFTKAHSDYVNRINSSPLRTNWYDNTTKQPVATDTPVDRGISDDFRLTPVSPINKTQRNLDPSLTQPNVQKINPTDPYNRMGVNDIITKNPFPSGSLSPQFPEKQNFMERSGTRGLVNNIGNLYQLGNAIFNKEKTEYVPNEYQGKALEMLGNRRFDINPMLASNASTFGAGRAALDQGGMSQPEQRAHLTNYLRQKFTADTAAHALKNNTEAGWKSEESQAYMQAGEANRSAGMATNQANEQNRATRQSAIASSLGAIGGNVMKQYYDDKYLMPFVKSFV